MLYMVCEADSVKKLNEEVNLYLRKGWKAQGGVAVVCSPSTAVWWFYQAMVRLGGADPDQVSDLA